MFTRLLGLQYRIVYKPRTDNRVADALSRRSHPVDLLSISTAVPSWLDDITASYASDPKAQELLAKLSVAGSAGPNFSLQQGLLRHHGRIWIGADASLQQRIIAAFYDSAIGGHSGFPATYQRIKQLFSWTGLKTVVQQFVASCPTCQQSKPDRARYPGLLQPLHVPTMA